MREGMEGVVARFELPRSLLSNQDTRPGVNKESMARKLMSCSCLNLQWQGRVEV